MKKEIKKQNGFAALLTIVIISAAALILAVSASKLSFVEIETGFIEQKGGEAFAIADGCAEEALERLRVNPGYSGEFLSILNGSCIIDVDSIGATRVVSVTSSTTDSYYKKIEVTANLGGNVISIINWEEKDD